MKNQLYSYLFYYFIASTLLRSLIVLLSSNYNPVEHGELRVRRLVKLGSFSDLLHLVLATLFFTSPINLYIKNFMFMGITFHVQWTTLSLFFVWFSVFTIILMAKFATRYLHRDVYYFKFFSILFLLELSLLLLILTNGIETIFIGWELLGLSSILLIAFYEYRTSVLKNSLRILFIYKISDIVFYLSLIYAASMGITNYTDINSTYAILLIFSACLIKSSIFPWLWLPRAMEGPTPSSAIFYGGLATHVPLFILINLFTHMKVVLPHDIKLIYASLIVASVLLANLLTRITSDAKNSIAYAAITQLGIIYLEVLLGYYQLAIFHTILHGLYRTLELLRTPSQLYDRHLSDTQRKSLIKPGIVFTKLLPLRIRLFLYKLTFHEFILPKLLNNYIEKFMGLNIAKVSLSSVKTYIFLSLSTFIVLELISVYTFGYTPTLFDESVLIMAYCFNVIALLYKYRPMLFLTCLSLSTFITLTCLAEIINPHFALLDIFYPLLLLGFSYHYYKNSRHFAYKTVHPSRSPLTLTIVFLVGLSIVGFPGLGTFYFWQRLEHHLIHLDPEIIIDAFVLISFNTLLFFRFYYANFLGQTHSLRHIKAASRK